MRKSVVWSILAVSLAVIIAGYILLKGSGANRSNITIVISPYQDLAMLVNLEGLNLEKKYGTMVQIKTIPWEETYTTLLSASHPADMGFSSFADYLTKAQNVNKGSDDPLLFIYPAYIFKGGAFVSFKPDMIAITEQTLNDPETLKKFLSRRLGFQKDTLYQMIIYHLADQAGINPESIKFVDVGFDAGLLGAQAGDIDAAAVGLTQLTEAQKRGGRVVLDMNSLKLADVTGFIARKSVVEQKRDHVANVIRMWFDCVDFVFTDLDKNSANSLAYLEKHAATKYTLQSYKAALSQEYFPRSIRELNKELLSPTGMYPIENIYTVIIQYLRIQGVISESMDKPQFLNIAG